MNSPYPKFTYLGQTVIIKPGSQFSKNELNSRLHQMGVQYDQSSLSKRYFNDLYENALKYDNNKVKIFERLIKDTIIYNNIKGNKINISQNIVESPNKNSKIAIIENKAINKDMLRNNKNNIENNNTQKDILNKNNQNISYGNNNNDYNNNYSNNNYNNSFEQRQNVNNWKENNKYNNSNNRQSNFKESIVNEIKKNQNIINNTIQQNENNKIYYAQGPNQIQNYEQCNYNQQNNRKNIRENSQNYNNISQNYNNDFQNNYNNQSINNYNQQSNNFDQAQRNYLLNQSQPNVNNMNESGHINQSQINQNYQNQSQNFNMNQNYSNSPKQSYYNNSNQEYSNRNSINMNLPNSYPPNKYERKNCIKNENEFINYSNNSNKYNNDNSGTNAISLSIQNAINDNNRNLQMGQSINSFQNYPNNLNRNQPIMVNNSQNSLDYQDDGDAQSTFSLASKFEQVKDYFSNKENRDFCWNIVQMVIIGIIIFTIFRYCIRFSHSVGEKVKETAEIIKHPGQTLRNVISGLLNLIFVEICWKNIYIILTFGVVAYIVYRLKAKFEFEALCKQIMEDIKEELRKKQPNKEGIRAMTESEILSKYSKKYNIDFNLFAKKYFKELEKLRMKDHSLKKCQIINKEGSRLPAWYLTEEI